MKHTRVVNRDRFIDWFASQPDRLPRERLSLRSGVSSSTINQMLCGRLPGEVTRRKIAMALEVPEDELFPIVEESKKFVR